MDFGSIIVSVVILIGSLLKRGAFLILSTSLAGFGALALLPPTLTFGATITASAFSFLVFAIKSYVNCGNEILLRAIFSFKKFGFLTMYISWCWVCTSIMPWIFNGEIYIYPVRATAGYLPVPVEYSSTNITQLMYLSLSYVITISVYVGFDDAQRKFFFTKSILGLSFVMIATGTIDLLGGKFFLEIFKNANYGLAEDTAIGSTQRVIGAMPEASSYGGMTASVFSTLLILRNLFNRNVFWLACLVGTFGMSILSASSTAYGTLFAAICVFLLQSTIRASFDGRSESERSMIEVLFIGLMSILLLQIILYFDDLSRIAFELLDSLIFNKTSSDSFEERSRWSKAALDAFIDSYGLGIGVGVARTSNGMINILCSTGIVGASSIILFLISTYIYKSKFRSFSDTYSPFLSLMPPLFGFALAGTTPDYGALIAMLFAIQKMKQDASDQSDT